MVKKDNKFILCHLKILFIILITIIIFIIPTKTILASPLTYVPLDSWVYPAISRLETLQAFDGNDTVATNTLPLTRIEVVYLIDSALFNLQKGKLELNQQNLTLMDKLVNEFQDELVSIGIKVIPLNVNSSAEEINKDFSPNWLYESLKYFDERDILKDPSSLLSPQMSRRDMAFLVDEIIYQLQTEQIQITSLTEQDIEKLEALIIELNDELSVQGLKIVRLNKTTVILDNLKSTLKIEPYFTQKIDLFYPEDINIEKLNLFSELGARVSASISENTALYLNASIYTEGELSLQVQLNQAYIALRLPSFEIPTPSNTPFFPSLSSLEFPALDLMVGRDYMKWGPGYQGNLILSDNAPSFDMLKYSGTIDLNDFGGGYGKINFTKFFSLLDSLDGQNRYFSGQRLEYKPFDALTLGLSETVIISQDSSILFYNPLPFIPPYYVTWWIASMLSSQDVNCNVSADIELNFYPGIKLYGELMADDVIFFPEENPYPNRTGFLAGAYFADPLGFGNTDFRIEYTHINNYVYFPIHPWEDYLYQGEYIGHLLGPDADQLYLELTHRLSDKFNLSLSYTHERHGEGQVGIPLPSDPIIANENISLKELALFLAGPLLYFIVTNNINDEKQINYIINVLLIIGSLFGIYGILQYNGIDFSFWTHNIGRQKVFGLFGNVNYFAEYLIVPLPLAVSLFFVRRNKFKKILLLIGILAMSASLTVTITRSSYLGFGVSLIFMFFLYLARRGKNFIKENKKIFIIILAIIILITFLFALPNPLNKPGTVISKIKGRISVVQLMQGSSIKRRIAIWKFTALMINDHPLLGSGLGTFKYNSLNYQAKFFDQGENRHLYSYGFADKAHNEYLQLWAELGIIGLGIFIWLIISYFSYGLKLLKKIRDDGSGYKQGIIIGLMGAVVAVLVDGIFGYPLHLPATIVLFWLALGLTVAVTGSSKADAEEINATVIQKGTNKKIKAKKVTEKQRRTEDGKSNTYRFNPLLYIGIILLTIFLCVTIARPFVARTYWYYGNKEIKNENWNEAIKICEKALKWDPYLGQVYYDIGKILQSKGIYNLALEYFEKTAKYVDHPDLPRDFALIYLKKGQLDRAAIKLKQAISYQRDEKSMFPLYSELGNTYLQLNQQFKAFEELQKVIELAPNSREAQNAREIMQQIDKEKLKDKNDN